jgi:hypothetical protein
MTFANLHGYTDVIPYEVVRNISEKTLEVRKMNFQLSESWKPNFIPGGFCAHCTNQQDQEWIFSSNTENEIIRIRKRKDGKWYSPFGRHVLADQPRAFYDYNF